MERFQLSQQEHEDLHWGLDCGRQHAHAAGDQARELRITSLMQKLEYGWRQSGGTVLMPNVDETPPNVRQVRSLKALSWLVGRWRGR